MLQAAGDDAEQHATNAAIETVAVAARIVLHGRRVFACKKKTENKQKKNTKALKMVKTSTKDKVLLVLISVH